MSNKATILFKGISSSSNEQIIIQSSLINGATIVLSEGKQYALTEDELEQLPDGSYDIVVPFSSTSNSPASDVRVTQSALPTNAASESTLSTLSSNVAKDSTVQSIVSNTNGVAKDGTDATGISPPTGATGIRGWLSGLYNLFLGGSAKVQVSGSNLSSVTTLQNATSSVQASGATLTELSTAGYGVAILEITGTFVATISFEAKGPSGTWYSISALQRGTGIISTTATSTGLYEINTRGISSIRARVSSYTSGSVTILGQAQPLSTGGEFINATISSSSIQLPTDIQSRWSTTTQTHNAVSVAASGVSVSSSWVDCSGFDRVGVTMLSDSATSNSIDFIWSNDSSTMQGQETVVTSAASTRRAGAAEVKARYLKVQISNGDTAASHTMSAWVYLKA